MRGGRTTGCSSSAPSVVDRSSRWAAASSATSRGFVAATYLRGVPFVQAPTSLLAMVDASIGGKVGVDHPRGKNLIGAFYPPRLVVQDTSLLASLPPRSLREGFAEVIKHGLIMDAPMLDVLERDAERLLAVEPELTTEIVARNAALKAGVVSRGRARGRAPDDPQLRPHGRPRDRGGDAATRACCTARRSAPA